MYGDEEEKTGGYAGYGGYLSRTIFLNKNTPSMRATKIIKNQEGRYFVVWTEEYSTLY